MAEMDLILGELRALRLVVEGLQSEIGSGEVRVVCGGVTGKGTRCRNRALVGTEYCKMHGEGRRAPTGPERGGRKPKEKKMKKIQPAHTHGIGEVPLVPCELCETHGDVWNPLLTEEGFCHVIVTD